MTPHGPVRPSAPAPPQRVAVRRRTGGRAGNPSGAPGRPAPAPPGIGSERSQCGQADGRGGAMRVEGVAVISDHDDAQEVRPLIRRSPSRGAVPRGDGQRPGARSGTGCAARDGSGPRKRVGTVRTVACRVGLDLGQAGRPHQLDADGARVTRGLADGGAAADDNSHGRDDAGCGKRSAPVTAGDVSGCGSALPVRPLPPTAATAPRAACRHSMPSSRSRTAGPHRASCARPCSVSCVSAARCLSNAVRPLAVSDNQVRGRRPTCPLRMWT